MTPNTLTFVVPGEPQAKQRARVYVRGAHVRAVTPAATRAYEERVRVCAAAAAARARWTLDGDDYFEVALTVVRTHWDSGGDVDNAGKAVLDAMNGVAYPDDRYVRALTVTLAEPSRDNPHVVVTVRRYPRPKRKRRAA